MSEQTKPAAHKAAKGDSVCTTDPPAESALPIAHFDIHYHQYLNHRGELLCPLPDSACEPERLIALYRAMLQTRLFDTRAIALQRTGQLGTYASPLGQEAIGAAIGAAMLPEDLLAPAYRDYAAQFSRVVSMTEILLYWGGDERGMEYQVLREDFPICFPVASHSAHAVGAAYAFKYRGQPRVAVCMVGDGGTSKGDFYEALHETCTAEVETAVKAYLETAPLAPESMLDHLYAELPRALHEQRLQASRRRPHD